MRTIIISLAKKYIVKALNDLLQNRSQDVSKITTETSRWIGRLEKILTCLKNLNERASDANISDEEADKTLEEFETLVKEF